MAMSTSNNTVYVSNLNYKADRQVLRGLFIKFGTVKNIKLVVEPSTNQSRGMAFVEMATMDQAQKAIENLHGLPYGGRTLKARFAIPQRGPVISKPVKDKNVDGKKWIEKDLEFTSVQLAKKARNEKRRNSNPIVYKYVPAKKNS